MRFVATRFIPQLLQGYCSVLHQSAQHIGFYCLKGQRLVSNHQYAGCWIENRCLVEQFALLDAQCRQPLIQFPGDLPMFCSDEFQQFSSKRGLLLVEFLDKPPPMLDR